MKQALVKKGQVIVEEVPRPLVEAGRVLVQVMNSCISIGTELSGIRGSGMPLWKRALKQPQNVKKALRMVKEKGLLKAGKCINGKLDTAVSTGYSAAGTVVAVGEGIDDIHIGDVVACAGAQCAFHAEYINVPRNLTVRVPENVDTKEACTVTLGAIAMQGVRRAQPTLGENFVVIGLGVIGQLTVQFLKASGCRVIASDLDRVRIAQAVANGADYGVHPDDGVDIEQVELLTVGIGADGVIITAATPSNAVVSTAFKMCRRKGRVVLVGDVGLNLNREDFYSNEIDFLISTSYGPGRYDDLYEERGMEYPVGYVRWTENRNMEEYLRLLSDKRVQVKSMIQAVYPIEQAGEAYACLQTGEERPLMVLLSYPSSAAANAGSTKIMNLAVKRSFTKSKINIAVIGAGGFAKGVHLPNIKAMGQYYNLQAVMSRTGHNAMSTAKQFGAGYATTDYQEILHDKAIDAVLITTRHNLHATMVLQALQAGKNVLVEKPLVLSPEELAELQKFFADKSGTTPMLTTGFNRRFSKYAQAAYRIVAKRINPIIINYRMNAGYIPLDSWVHGVEGGGRNIGEACHIYDLFNFFTGSKVIKVQAQSINTNQTNYSNRDNFVATVSYEDGSVATLTYTALGNNKYPKEQMELYCDGKIIVMEDYKAQKVYGTHAALKTQVSEKGQKEELEAFAMSIL